MGNTFGAPTAATASSAAVHDNTTTNAHENGKRESGSKSHFIFHGEKAQADMKCMMDATFHKEISSWKTPQLQREDSGSISTTTTNTLSVTRLETESSRICGITDQDNSCCGGGGGGSISSKLSSQPDGSCARVDISTPPRSIQQDHDATESAIKVERVGTPTIRFRLGATVAKRHPQSATTWHWLLKPDGSYATEGSTPMNPMTIMEPDGVASCQNSAGGARQNRRRRRPRSEADCARDRELDRVSSRQKSARNDRRKRLQRSAKDSRIITEPDAVASCQNSACDIRFRTNIEPDRVSSCQSSAQDPRQKRRHRSETSSRRAVEPDGVAPCQNIARNDRRKRRKLGQRSEADLVTRMEPDKVPSCKNIVRADGRKRQQRSEADTVTALELDRVESVHDDFVAPIEPDRVGSNEISVLNESTASSDNRRKRGRWKWLVTSNGDYVNVRNARSSSSSSSRKRKRRISDNKQEEVRKTKPRKHVYCKKFELRWEEKFARLVAFRNIHKHTRVSGRGDTLESWVHRQRTLYKKGKLSIDRIVRLESIGFQWYYRDEWMKMYDRLLDYKENYDTVCVPYGEPKLSRWVSAQRYNRKIGNLKQERIDLLEAIGFEWDGIRGKSIIFKIKDDDGSVLI